MKTTNDVRLGTRGPSVFPIALGCMATRCAADRAIGSLRSSPRARNPAFRTLQCVASRAQRLASRGSSTKDGADLPLLLIFAGVVGGLIAFGVTGLFIGPVVLAVAYTLLVDWVSEGNHRMDESGPRRFPA